MAWVEVAQAVTTGRHGPQALLRIAMFPAAIFDIMVGMSAAQALEYQREAAGSNLRGEVDASAIYAAVREGASDATISISIDGRELRRTLDGLGVVLA